MLLLWCRPRRDREVQGQLAKIEIQLDVLREMNEKILKTHQQILSTGPNQRIKGRRQSLKKIDIQCRKCRKYRVDVEYHDSP